MVSNLSLRYSMLQRGRAQLSAESRKVVHFSRRHGHVASTGPRSIERGELGDLFRRQRRGEAASTGPRSIERGEVTNLVALQSLSYMLQRGRAQLSAESSLNYASANQHQELQRGRAQLSAESRKTAVALGGLFRSFNGAALN